MVEDGQLPRPYLDALEHHHKLFALLRVHRRYESEKMFGTGPALKGNQTAEFHYLQPPKQLVPFDENTLPLVLKYTKSFSHDQEKFENATYKMIHPEAKLVRHILEYNGIHPTNDESNTWSTMWSTNSVNNKPQLMNDLFDG